MNLHEALKTANWLLEREAIEEGEPAHLLEIRKMRDTLFYLHAAAGITEIVIQMVEGGGGLLS